MCETIGIGIDLCAVPRMERACGSAHFVERVFTVEEQRYLNARGKGFAQSAAAMFAAKEAVAKALGTGFSLGVMPWQIEVIHAQHGAPSVALYGAAEERFRAMRGGKVLLSLTHEGDMAAAYAVIVST